MTPDPTEPLYTASEVRARERRSYWVGMVVGAALYLAIVAMLAT